VTQSVEGSGTLPGKLCAIQRELSRLAERLKNLPGRYKGPGAKIRCPDLNSIFHMLAHWASFRSEKTPPEWVIYVDISNVDIGSYVKNAEENLLND